MPTFVLPPSSDVVNRDLQMLIAKWVDRVISHTFTASSDLIAAAYTSILHIVLLSYCTRTPNGCLLLSSVPGWKSMFRGHPKMRSAERHYLILTHLPPQPLPAGVLDTVHQI
jgi:hypothetical protein